MSFRYEALSRGQLALTQKKTACLAVLNVNKTHQPAPRKLPNNNVLSCLFYLYKNQRVKTTTWRFTGEGLCANVPDYSCLGAISSWSQEEGQKIKLSPLLNRMRLYMLFFSTKYTNSFQHICKSSAVERTLLPFKRDRLFLSLCGFFLFQPSPTLASFLKSESFKCFQQNHANKYFKKSQTVISNDHKYIHFIQISAVLIDQYLSKRNPHGIHDMFFKGVKKDQTNSSCRIDIYILYMHIEQKYSLDICILRTFELAMWSALVVWRYLATALLYCQTGSLFFCLQMLRVSAPARTIAA